MHHKTPAGVFPLKMIMNDNKTIGQTSSNVFVKGYPSLALSPRRREIGFSA
jgi:hypothetical protein